MAPSSNDFYMTYVGERGGLHTISTGTSYNTRLSKPDSITIKEVNRGFIVQAGCQEFVFTSKNDLIHALRLFYTDYEKAYKKYMEDNK